MSRDIAPNSVLPLFAGTELIRRTGALLTFPIGDIIGELPMPASCGSQVIYASTPVVWKEGYGVNGLASYSVFEKTYTDFLAANPEQCQALASTLQITQDGLGALPFAADGSSIGDLLSPAHWIIEPIDPALYCGLGVQVASADPDGNITSWGTMVVERFPGQGITFNTSSLTMGWPTTFGPELGTFFANGIVNSNINVGTWWPDLYASMSSPIAWVDCLMGGPGSCQGSTPHLPSVFSTMAQTDIIASPRWNMSGVCGEFARADHWPQFAEVAPGGVGGVIQDFPGTELLECSLTAEQTGTDAGRQWTQNSVTVWVRSEHTIDEVRVDYTATNSPSFDPVPFSLSVPMFNFGDPGGTGKDLYAGVLSMPAPIPWTDPMPYGEFITGDMLITYMNGNAPL